jgi:hypothetical protein
MVFSCSIDLRYIHHLYAYQRNMIDKNQMMREGKEDWTILDQALFSIDDANGNQIFLFFSDSYRGEKT